MDPFKDYGTNEWDDLMAREIPYIERVVGSLGKVLDQVSERFAPDSPYVEQIKQQYDAAVSALQRHKDIIVRFRQQESDGK
jgi:hypothetical protein